MLTARQKQIKDFINKTISKRGIAPTEREIAHQFKISPSTTHEHLATLQDKGYLEKARGRARGIKIVDFNSGLVQIPLLGTIAAGQPLTLFDVPRETIAIPKNKISSSYEVYALRVVGNSMINENINDGDVVLVRHQDTADNGQKVVALIDNQEATLKKFYKERGYIRLQPANEKMEPIIIRKDRDFIIQGIVLDVIKDEKGFQDNSILIKERNIVTSHTDNKNYKPKIQGDKFEFYLGDCLEVIPTLEKRYSVVYLDPPFNTNRNYKYQKTDDTHIFTDKWAHGEYEEWIEKLIILCKSKLKKDGSLFFHISAELSFTPEKVLRKHFKKVEPIFWKKAHGKNTVKNKLGAVVDIIFKASENGSKFNLLYVPLDEYYFENSYKNKDDVGYYALGSIKHDKTRRGHIYSIKKGGIVYEAPYGWKIPKEKLERLMRENKIHFAKPKPDTNRAMLYKKLYKHEVKGKPLSNLWDDIAYITRTTKDQRFYPTQKPLELLKRIVQLSSNEGDWILDPVAGSGTTGIAALNLDRKATLIDINPDSRKIISERLRAIDH